MVLELLAIPNDLLCAGGALLRQGDVKLPSILFRARAADVAPTLQLGKHLGDGSRADARDLLKVTLRHVAAALVEPYEDVLLAAAASRVKMQEVAKKPKVVQHVLWQ